MKINDYNVVELQSYELNKVNGGRRRGLSYALGYLLGASVREMINGIRNAPVR